MCLLGFLFHISYSCAVSAKDKCFKRQSAPSCNLLLLCTGLDMVMENGEDYVIGEIAKTKKKMKDMFSLLETQQQFLRLIVQVLDTRQHQTNLVVLDFLWVLPRKSARVCGAHLNTYLRCHDQALIWSQTNHFRTISFICFFRMLLCTLNKREHRKICKTYFLYN